MLFQKNDFKYEVIFNFPLPILNFINRQPSHPHYYYFIENEITDVPNPLFTRFKIVVKYLARPLHRESRRLVP